MLSVAAGLIHASVIDAHRGHGAAPAAFAAVAVVQVAWAGLVLARPSRWVIAAGAGATAAVVGGWALSRTSGIPFIDGFQDVEDVGFTDAVVTGLEVLLLLGALVLLGAPGLWRAPAERFGSLHLGAVAVLVALAAVPAVAEAGSFHDHGQRDGTAAHGDGHEHGEPAAAEHADRDESHHAEAAGVAAVHEEPHADEVGHVDAHQETPSGTLPTSHVGDGGSHEHAAPSAPPDDQAAAAPPDDHAAGHPQPLPGDHDGHHPEPPPPQPPPDSGVTPEQRAAADRLLEDTKSVLPQWTDEVAHAAGFRSIGDAGTGTEHLVNWRWLTDGVVLDPRRPESLVYRISPDGTRVLAAAMYVLPPGTTAEGVPDIGGTLTQWHVHNDLCLTPERLVDGHPERRVIGLTSPNGTCPVGDRLADAPMLHVWIVDHPCGPFSSLEGVGAGQAIDEPQDPAADPACQHSTH
jgi:hypothetical protein